MAKNDIPLFIPSYHRPDNLKTVKYFTEKGYDPKAIHVLIDSEADDRAEYEKVCRGMGVNLSVFDMDEARARYDYVHRASASRRSGGQARNMFQDYARSKEIDFYVVQDDDTTGMEIKRFGRYSGMADIETIRKIFRGIEGMMRRRKIGLFGLPQTGDFIGGDEKNCIRWKVMNTTFYLLPYVYRGERGVQDDDTSLFTGVMNEGLFTGSLADGLSLKQTTSATAGGGGLTDLYRECKLLNKSLVVPIQYPSAVNAEYQTMNGNRIHHHIARKYLYPMVLKVEKGNNIAWDTYEEDIPFTNEPKRR